jgi:hypothetical protein
MAQDTPIYERNTPIRPSSGSGGAIQSSFNYAAQAMQTGVTPPSATDKFISDISQQAANQVARDAGMKAATNPGQSFLGIGESGKHFADAYHREEVQIASYNGTQGLQKIYGLADKERRPTQQTLDAYRKEGLELIEENVLELSPSAQEPLRRSLMESYNSDLNRLSKKVHESDFQTLKEQSDLSYSQKTQMMDDSALEGYGNDARRFQKESVDIVNNAENLRLITPEQAFSRREELEKRLQINLINGEALERAKSGNSAEWLRDLAESDRLDVLGPSLRQDVIESARRTIGSYDSALASSRFIEMSHAEQEAEAGTLTSERLDYYKERLGDEDTARLMNKISHKAHKQAEFHQKVVDIGKNANVPMWLAQNTKPEEISQYTTAILNDAQNKVGRPLSMQEESELFSGLKVENPVLKQHLTSAMVSGDPELMKDASLAIDNLSRNNPNAISGLNEKQKAMALQISELSAAGSTTEAAIAAATKNIIGVSPQDMEKREKVISGGEEFKRYRDVDQWKDNAFRITGFDKSMIPDGLAYDVFNQMKAGYLIHGDMNMAEKYAQAAIKRVWGETNINGIPEVMKTPPDLLMPNGDKIVKAQLERQVEGLTLSSKALYDSDPKRLWHYELEKPISEKESRDLVFEKINAGVGMSPEEEAHYKARTPRLRKVYRDNILPTETYDLLLKSDQYTITPDQAGPYSYFPALRGAGGISPLEDPRDGKIMRFVIKPEEQQAAIKAERLAAEEKFKRRAELKKEIMLNQALVPSL